MAAIPIIQKFIGMHSLVQKLPFFVRLDIIIKMTGYMYSGDDSFKSFQALISENDH